MSVPLLLIEISCVIAIIGSLLGLIIIAIFRSKSIYLLGVYSLLNFLIYVLVFFFIMFSILLSVLQGSLWFIGLPGGIILGPILCLCFGKFFCGINILVQQRECPWCKKRLVSSSETRKCPYCKNIVKSEISSQKKTVKSKIISQKEVKISPRKQEWIDKINKDPKPKNQVDEKNNS